MLRSFKLDQQDNLKYITRDFGTMVASFSRKLQVASWKVQKRIKQAAVLNAYMFNLIIHIKAEVTVSTVFTDGFCSHLIPQRALHPILPKTRR